MSYYYSTTTSQSTLGAYTRLQILGKGSFGQVHLAQSSTGELCAYKETDLTCATSAARQAALQEPELHMAVSQHANIVSYRESETTDRRVTIVMEYCTGGTLAEKRTRDGSATWSDAQIMSYFAPLCLALKHCHDLNVVHRDIKPDNVFLTLVNGVEHVRLGDFGLACRIKPGYYDVVAAGTPACSSPEISQGQPYCSSTDVWSLGIVLYWMLSGGRLPFSGSTKEDMKYNIMYTEPAPLPSAVSLGLRSLVAQMLQKNETLRPTMAQILGNEVVMAAIAAAEVAAVTVAEKVETAAETETACASDIVKEKQLCTNSECAVDVPPKPEDTSIAMPELADTDCSCKDVGIEEALEEEVARTNEHTVDETDAIEHRWSGVSVQLKDLLHKRVKLLHDDKGAVIEGSPLPWSRSGSCLEEEPREESASGVCPPAQSPTSPLPAVSAPAPTVAPAVPALASRSETTPTAAPVEIKAFSLSSPALAATSPNPVTTSYWPASHKDYGKTTYLSGYSAKSSTGYSGSSYASGTTYSTSSNVISSGNTISYSSSKDYNTKMYSSTSYAPYTTATSSRDYGYQASYPSSTMSGYGGESLHSYLTRVR